MKTYLLKKEFFPMVGISTRQWDRRKKDLLKWLENFYDFEILEGQPIRIIIKEQYGQYQPLPRSLKGWTLDRESKYKDYKDFIFSQLGEDYIPTSKTKLARDAIKNFAFKKYGHTNEEAVANRYIKPILDQYAESSEQSVWVFQSNYSKMPEEAVQDWERFLKEGFIDQASAAIAFYSDDEDEEEKNKQKCAYYAARNKFKKKYGDMPLLVKEWKIKTMGVA